MKLKLAENSLFAILMRQPWWISALAALVVFGGVRYFLPVPLALFSASPFIFIAAFAAWKQFRTPSGAKLDAALTRLQAMPWEDVAAALEAGFRREGYQVKLFKNDAFDLELEKSGRVARVAAKRWKATQTGVEPLKDVLAAADGRDCVYVFAGEMSKNARDFAAQKKIRLVERAEIATLTNSGSGS